MDRGAIGIVHLVELVDDAAALVGEDESASLQRPLARDGTLLHIGGQTDGAGAFVRIKVTLLINHYNKNKLANYF